MASKSNSSTNRRSLSCLAITGLGIGFLVGLSSSPVVEGVITSLIAATVTIASVLAGIKTNEPSSEQKDSRKRRLDFTVDPLPVTVLVVAIVVGSPLGIIVRTHNWLGTLPTVAEAAKPDTDSKSASDDSDDSEQKPGVYAGVLFSNVSADDALRLRGATEADVVPIAAQCDNPEIRRFAEVFGDRPDVLYEIISKVILWQEDTP